MNLVNTVHDNINSQILKNKKYKKKIIKLDPRNDNSIEFDISRKKKLMMYIYGKEKALQYLQKNIK